MKTKVEKSTAQIAADRAREAYAKAKDANEKADNATTKKALETARAARDTAVKAESAERFSYVAPSRTKKARAAIRQLVKVANPKSYSFTPEQAAKIVTGLQECVNEVERAFKSPSVNNKAGDSFTL